MRGTIGILLAQGALCLMLIAAAADALRAHGDLSGMLVRQHEGDALVGRIDTQLDALARGTQELAQAGDANAAAVIETLAQSGIHVNARAKPQ